MPGRPFRPRRRQQRSRISARNPARRPKIEDTLTGRHLPSRWDAALKRFPKEPFKRGICNLFDMGADVNQNQPNLAVFVGYGPSI